jgi:asparagine synthase (glutamine-hydrolysing)
VSLRGEPVDRAVLDRMNETLMHRGPDSGGVHVSPGAGLGARRLSIIDLAGGDQPIANEDETVWVVQNGEIYNFPELREEVEAAGHRLRTRCDTEIHLHLYELYGPGYVERLRGMFAVAIWDTRERLLVLARDRFGIKPLYYRVAGGTLAFGSELKALLVLPDFSRELDPDAVEAYFDGGYVPAPLTIFRGARKLPQGHLLTLRVGDAEPSVDRYARPSPTSGIAGSDDELAEELRVLLRDSVRAHLLSDVPVGVLLSGGVDSSALTALAAEQTSEPLHTFSIGFAEESYDELAKARVVAERFGTEHHELRLSPNIVELFPAVAESFDEPFADDAAIPTYLVSKLAAQTVKVSLAGEGGDELFGGYDVYAAHSVAGLARPFTQLLRRVPSPRVRRFAGAATLPAFERHLAWKRMFTPEVRHGLLRSHGVDPTAHYRARWDETNGADSLARVLEHGPLARGARSVPRHGVERVRVRSPLATQGARPGEETATSQGACPARPGGDPLGAQARLHAPGGAVAARAARAVRTRAARERPRLVRRRNAHAVARRSRHGPERQLEAAVDTALVRRVVRPLRLNSRRRGLGGLDVHDLERELAARRGDLDGLALLAPHDRFPDGRFIRELVLGRIRLGRADDVVLDRLAGFDVAETHLRPDGHLARLDLLLRDHARALEPLLEHRDARFKMCLLVLRGVVLGVLGDVAELARFTNAIRDLASLFRREVLDLLLELLVPVGSENDFLQDLGPPGDPDVETAGGGPHRPVRRGRMVPRPPMLVNSLATMPGNAGESQGNVVGPRR